jgi:hypothetical protein
MRKYVIGLVGLGSALAALHGGDAPPPPTPVPVIVLHERHGHATPTRQGCDHTAGGNTDVAQPTPDTVIVTMTGVSVAGAHPCKDSVATMDFDFSQCLDIVQDGAKGKQVKVTTEARVIGLLRTHKKGGAAEESGSAAFLCGPEQILSVVAPEHSVTCGENLSINDHDGPYTALVSPGKYTLHQIFHVSATHAHNVLPCKAASAEFAPDPALDPLWISYWEPFHGANKKDFGFQVIVKVAPE